MRRIHFVFMALLAVAALMAPVAQAQGPRPDRPDMDRFDRPGWDQAPGQYNEIERRGFQDGLYGARKDAENHRRPDPNNRDEYRRPNVPPRQREAYRAAFRRGYAQGMNTLMTPVVPPDQGGWGAGQQTRQSFERMGYDEGFRGAQKDYENRRRPDPNNRDEYRMPRVPPRFAEAYRSGFRQGYRKGVEAWFGRGPSY